MKEDHVGTDDHTAVYGGPHNGAGGDAVKAATACGEPMLEQAPGNL